MDLWDTARNVVIMRSRVGDIRVAQVARIMRMDLWQ